MCGAVGGGWVGLLSVCVWGTVGGVCVCVWVWGALGGVYGAVLSELDNISMCRGGVGGVRVESVRGVSVM